MPRFGFKSSSSGGSNSVSLNSPRVASFSRSKTSSSSRDVEQSTKDRDSKSKQSSKNSRRRNFGFLKTGIGRTEKASSDKNAISKRREHAKQLANLAYSDDPTTSIATTATCNSTNDIAYNMNTTIISPANNNINDANTSFFAQQQSHEVNSSSKSKKNIHSRPRTNSNKSATSNISNNSNISNIRSNDAFGSDPFASFDAFGMSSSSPIPEPTSKYSDTDFSELDFFAGQLAGATTPVYKAKENHHRPQQQQQHQQPSSSKKSSRRKNQPVSLDHFFTDDDASSFTSNQTGNDLSTIDNGGSSISNGVSAAARRRMRSHMQGKQSNSSGDIGSGSSVGSGTSSSLARSQSVPQMPPVSPGINPKSRMASQKNGKNNGWGSISSSDHHSPFRSTGSVTSSTANYSSSSPGVNLFDSDNEAGFTFDAFGLDESQVEREVNSAMKDILGNGGFSVFDAEDHSGSSRTLESGSESGQGSGNNSVSSGNKNNNSYSRQDSFSGHQTDTSDNSFEAQNWDSSPNTSRNQSPVIRQKPPVQLSSVQKRRLQRSAQRGIAAPAATMTPQRGNSNNGSLRQISSEPPAKTKTAADFDPWPEDPFASSDDGGRLSDFFTDNGRDVSTARRLYSETQSNVQDYYPSGRMAAAANSLLDATSPKQMTPSNQGTGSNNSNYARSDVGVSDKVHLSFESPKAAPGFFELPPEEEIENQSESDQSDDMDQMQDDMAHEFSNDVVRRISPSSQGSNSHHNSPSKRSANASGRSFRSHATNPSRDEKAAKRIQYGDDRIDESESDDQAVKDSNSQHSNYKNSQQYPSQSINTNRETNNASTPSTSRFGSFRSRYERSRSSSAISQAKTPTASNTKNDIGRNSYHGSLRSSYDASKTRSETIDMPDEPKAIPKWQQSQGHSREAPIEEKKEEEIRVHHRAPDPTPPKVNSLKARWEAKTRAAPVEKPVPRVFSKPSERSDHTKRNIDKMDNSFEMLTPDIMEQRRQTRNKDKFNNLRKSMGVVDEEKKPNSGGWKGGSAMLGKVLDHVERESPSTRFQPSKDFKSDIGSSPSYLSNAHVRKEAGPTTNYSASVHEKGVNSSFPSNGGEPTEQAFSPTASPLGRKLTYREQREMELRSQREQEEAKKVNSPFQHQPPVQKKMNYRERREMELKLKREQEQAKIQSPVQQNTPKQDVASLIRKRISANKKKESPPQDSYQSSSISSKIIQQPLNTMQKEETSHPISQDQTKRFESSSEEQPSSNRLEVANGFTNSTGADIHKNKETGSNGMDSPRKNPGKMLENLFASRASPALKQPVSPTKSPHQILDNFLSAKTQVSKPKHNERPIPSTPDVSQKVAVPDDVSQSDAKSMLSGFLAKRSPPALPFPSNESESNSVERHPPSNLPSKNETEPPAPPPTSNASCGFPVLKNDPKFERYFRMLNMGLPLEVAKHAMVRDGLDPSVLDMDHNKPIGVPMKDDPKFTKYFKMLKMGISMDQVKHGMERDGLNPAAMDQDHNLPVITVEKKKVKKKKETHRRARLHWKSIGNIVKNSLWDTVQSEVGGISIDEDEFDDLFQAELKASNVLKTTTSTSKKKGAAIRVIDSKRANNGGIILARVKLTHDQMADAVDRIDASTLTAEQIEHVIEYLPTKEERDALEKYMLEGGQDAAEKFDGLCECEKFMVSMMTVKHAKRKVRALLFKLQFMTCMDSITKDSQMIDTACDELINSNRLRQLLGIILQFGNRLNTAGSSSKSKAGGFSLESLSKLSQAKAFDKKTTFLHYIILIIERNNELLLKFYDDIPTVLEAVNIFWDQCQQDLEEVENQLENVRRMALHEARANDSQITGVSDDDSLGELELTLEEEVVSLRASPTGLFTLGAIKQVSALREKIERTRAKCLRLKQYFGVVSQSTEPQEIFSVFATFTTDFKKAKEQVFSTASKRLREERKKVRQTTPKKPKPREPMMRASGHQPNMNKMFSDIQQRQPSNSSTRQDSQSDVQPSRAGLLSSIKERQSPSERSVPSPPNPRAGILDAIKQRQSPSSATANPRAGILDAIKQRQSPSSATANPRAGILDAIKQRQSPSSTTANPRAGILDAIKNRQPPADPRASLLDAIKKPQPPSEISAPFDPREGLLSAIKQRNPDSEIEPSSENQSAFVTERHQSKPITANSRSPREAMRHHRRRLEAVRSRHGN